MVISQVVATEVPPLTLTRGGGHGSVAQAKPGIRTPAVLAEPKMKSLRFIYSRERFGYGTVLEAALERSLSSPVEFNVATAK